VTRYSSIVMRGITVVAAVAACSGGSPATVTESPSRRPQIATPAPVTTPDPIYFRRIEPPAGPGPGAALPVVAARVFALGDTQFHHMYGKRGFAQSPFADRYSNIEVAIRPAALDDGNDLLLAAFLAERRARHADASLVYMGDAADLSCVQELDRFAGVMTAARESHWLMVTSNHDGFYVGNYTQKSDLDGDLQYTDMPDDWTRACAEPGRTDDFRLTKGRAVARIAATLPEAPAWATHVAADNVAPTGYASTYLAYARPLTGGDRGAPPAWGLFFDTVDYRDYDVRKSRGAGTVGSISRAQLVALDRAMLEVDAATPTSWIAFGHHPIAELDRGSRERLFRFLDARPRVVAYVSAHTHHSDDRRHTLPSGRKLVEIVVGATGDFGNPSAPGTARAIEVRVDPAAGTAGAASWRIELDVDRLCDGVAPMSAADPLGYTAYRLNRDDTSDLPSEITTLLWAKIKDWDLQPYRVAQATGALVVENKLVRSLAAMYAGAPGETSPEHARALQALIDAPVLPVSEMNVALTAWDQWTDPVLASDVPRLARRLHRFSQHRDLFEALRATRTATEPRRRYFACHAARAAEAEARRPRGDRSIRRIR
jgi:hypothetical protein